MVATKMDCLRTAAERAPAWTDIPRVPLIPQELHSVVWLTYQTCRYCHWYEGIDVLREFAKRTPGSELREFFGWKQPHGQCYLFQHFVRVLLGLRRW